MASFKKVLWLSAIEKHYDPRKPKILMDVLEEKVFEAAVDNAEANHEEWRSYILGVKNSGKIALDSIEGVLEKIKSADEREAEKLVQEVEKVAERLSKAFSEAKKTNEEYSSCFGGDGFRGEDLKKPVLAVDRTNLIDTAKLEKLISSVKSRREKIIAEDRGLVAERNRVEEYVDRAASILKAAQTLASGEKLERSAFKKEFEKIEASFKGDLGIDEAIRKLREKFDQGYSAAEKGPRALADSKLKFGTAEYPAVHKNLSGAVKTTALQLQTLKATYGKKLWSKMAISGMEKRLVQTIETVKKLGAEAEAYERKMTELMKKHLGV